MDRSVLLETVLRRPWAICQQPCTLESFLTTYAVPEEKVAPPPPPEPPLEQTYLVQDGDSLWKIARKLKVSIHDLKEKNQLQSDLLRPGKVLKVP